MFIDEEDLCYQTPDSTSQQDQQPTQPSIERGHTKTGDMTTPGDYSDE